MHTEIILPFIESTRNVMRTMMDLSVTFGKPALAEPIRKHDVSAIIGLSGDLVGSVVLSLPGASAQSLVTRFSGVSTTLESEDFSDAIGELVNMIAGAAKSSIKDRSISISCPSVVIGIQHSVSTPSDSVCIALPCETPLGRFSVEVSIRRKCIEAMSAMAGVRHAS